MAMNFKTILSAAAAGAALLAGCAVDPYAYDSRHEYGYGGPVYSYGAPYGYYEPYYGGGLGFGYVYSDRHRYDGGRDPRHDHRHDRRWDDRRDDRRDPAPPPGAPSTGEPRYNDRWGPSPGGG